MQKNCLNIIVICLVLGDVTAGKSTKYTSSVEMYANPHDGMDLYALPDTVQHYETVSLYVTHNKLLIYKLYTAFSLCTAHYKCSGNQSRVGHICTHNSKPACITLQFCHSLCMHTASEGAVSRGG